MERKSKTNPMRKDGGWDRNEDVYPLTQLRWRRR